MKKAVVLILAVICLFIFVGCNVEKVNDKTEVYTFHGENEYISVKNGTAVIDGDEEVFSGGNLEFLNNEPFADAVYWRYEFYILNDSEEKTIYVGSVSDEKGGASVNIEGDLGKISGGDTITKYDDSYADDFVNDLYFKFIVKNADGEENTYRLQMKVNKVY